MKTCFKCTRLLPLDEFYRHPQMGDGHLNKCKDCTKRDTVERVARMSQNLEWLLLERARCRAKAARFREEGRVSKRRPETTRKWIAANKVKRQAHNKVNHAVRMGRLTKQPCEVCANPVAQAHHDDYSKPLDVIWLCAKHHGERHVQLNEQKLLSK